MAVPFVMIIVGTEYPTEPFAIDTGGNDSVRVRSVVGIIGTVGVVAGVVGIGGKSDIGVHCIVEAGGSDFVNVLYAAGTVGIKEFVEPFFKNGNMWY